MRRAKLLTIPLTLSLALCSAFYLPSSTDLYWFQGATFIAGPHTAQDELNRLTSIGYNVGTTCSSLCPPFEEGWTEVNQNGGPDGTLTTYIYRYD